ARAPLLSHWGRESERSRGRPRQFPANESAGPELAAPTRGVWMPPSRTRTPKTCQSQVLLPTMRSPLLLNEMPTTAETVFWRPRHSNRRLTRLIGRRGEKVGDVKAPCGDA